MSVRRAAEVEHTSEENEDGREQECIIVTCTKSGDEAQAWGHSEASLKRALSELTEECSCGATWHYDESEEEE